MTSYLARLKAHIEAKKSAEPPGNGTALTVKRAFRSFHSTDGGRFLENSELEERAAIIAEGCGIDHEQALRQAAEETEEPDHIEIIANRIEVWLGALDSLHTPADTDERKLLSASKNFALSVWAHPALAAGWTDAELFARPVGLVPQMARRNIHLMNIDESAATLMSGKGIVENYERSRFQGGDERPWWHR